MSLSQKFLEGVAKMSTFKRVASGGLLLTAVLTHYEEDSDTYHYVPIRSRSMEAGDDGVELRKGHNGRDFHKYKDQIRADGKSLDGLFVECGDPAEDELRRILAENAQGHDPRNQQDPNFSGHVDVQDSEAAPREMHGKKKKRDK